MAFQYHCQCHLQSAVDDHHDYHQHHDDHDIGHDHHHDDDDDDLDSVCFILRQGGSVQWT